MAISTLECSAANNPDLAVPTRRSGTARREQVLRRTSLAVLLVGTGVLYLWGLSASGYANSFYSAAVQAGSQSWKAFFFGSLDAGNAITVDKPPASLWLMALSVRVFGLSSWSILAPQALLGVGTVGVLFATVRRTSGQVAGLIAGALLALTPVATLMFRFNNPDAMLVFLLTLAGYVTLRATEKASGRWLALAGALVGLAFLAKMLQAFLVLPAFVLVYLIAAPAPLRGRIRHLLVAFAAVVASPGWWVAIVELTPASVRPYVGGSQGNSVLELIFGYNGLSRIFGQGGGAGPGRGGGGLSGSSAGITRLFEGVSGGMVAWLIPAALILAAGALVVTRRAPRTDPRRAAVLLWVGWLIVTALVFSFMAGIYHDYYTVALAPAIAGSVAVAAQILWGRRTTWLSRVVLAAAMVVTGVWGLVLASQAGEAYAGLKWIIAATATLAAGGFLLSGLLVAPSRVGGPPAGARTRKTLASAVVGVALVGAGAGPAAYAVDTAATPHQGSIVTAGPVTGGGPGGAFGGQRGARTNRPGAPSGQLPPGGGAGPGGNGPGGAAGGETVDAQVTRMLITDASSYTWAAATTGSQSAAAFQLASQVPVMAIGGFNGGDPSPTLAQFKALVAQRKIHYYLGGQDGRGGFGGRNGDSSAIAAWVADTFTATTVGTTTVYDLTSAH